MYMYIMHYSGYTVFTITPSPLCASLMILDFGVVSAIHLCMYPFCLRVV